METAMFCRFLTHTQRKWLNRNLAMLVMFLSTIVFNPLIAQFNFGYPSSEPALSKSEEVWYTDNQGKSNSYKVLVN